jgi:pimeloyl-ACP methyl ester carboxylesterase
MTPTRSLPILFTLILALQPVNTPRAAAADKPPASPANPADLVFRVSTSPLRGDDDFHWTVPFDIVNRSGVGLYTDSLVCDADDLDLGVTGLDRHSRQALWSAARMAGSMAAGESVHFEFRMPPISERARLVFHYYGQRADHTPVTATAEADMVPGPASTRVPSAYADGKGSRVEYTVLHAESDAPAPILLVIPGEGDHARSVLFMMGPMHERGYQIVTMSLPGFGLSQGSADFMGPSSVAAAVRVLDQLRRVPGADTSRIAVWGIREGAAVAVQLAATHPSVKALVLESGAYDPWACWRAGDPAWQKRMSAAAGSDSAAWRARSAMNVAERVRVSTLIVHGQVDSVTPPAQAHAFTATLLAHGTNAHELMVPTRGHDLGGAAYRAMGDFLKRVFP